MFANSTSADLSGLFTAQKGFFHSGKTRDLGFRQSSLSALGQVIHRRQDDLLDVLALDLGKPRLEAYLAEIYFVLAEIRLAVKRLPAWGKARRVATPFFQWPARSEILREPLGCGVVIAPWNYPAQLSLSPLIGAVAGGNCVMLKPSEMAPATANLLKEILEEVFSPEHVSVVTGGAETGAALLDLPFDAWFYTGGERVGRLVAAAAARNMAPVTLELGGKCPCLLDRNVPLDQSVERIVTAKMFNAGQTCVAPDFVLVPREDHEAFLAKAIQIINGCYPAETARSDFARIVSTTHYVRLRNLLPEKNICIGEDDPGNLHLAPRLVPEPDWDSPVMNEEIFGPILPVLAYDDLEEVIAILQKRPAPLALYSFSQRQSFHHQVISALPSGSVGINDVMKQATNLNLPFGGVGASGTGRYRGRAGFDCFTYERSMTKRYFLKDIFLVKPPYLNRLKTLKKLLR
jgi:aldehyde dehydrogenase (NAD+)